MKLEHERRACRCRRCRGRRAASRRCTPVAEMQHDAEGARDRGDEDARAHARARAATRGGRMPRPAASGASGIALTPHLALARPSRGRRACGGDRRARRARPRACTRRSPRRVCRGLSATIRPSPRNSTRSAWLAAIGSCVTIAIDWPWSRLAAASSASTSRPLRESRLPVGSSANTRSGAVASARAIATRCCWPPRQLVRAVAAARSARPRRLDEPVDARALERRRAGARRGRTAAGCCRSRRGSARG